MNVNDILHIGKYPSAGIIWDNGSFRKGYRVPLQIPQLGILKTDLFVNPKLSFDCLIGAELFLRQGISIEFAGKGVRFRLTRNLARSI
ncbi:MAG: hypothetical protein WA364_18815 [Candidatus Nitrosopolaris sp.]